MKTKKTIFFLFSLLSFFVAKSQQPVSERLYDFLPNNMTIDKIISKTYKQSVSICYIENKQKHCFAYVETSASLAKYVFIDPRYNVEDFYIRNDSVFFCGKTEDVAFIGYYDIVDFFSGQSFYINNSLYSVNNKKITTLKKIVSFLSTNGDVHIVSIGTTENKSPCIIDVTNDIFNNTWTYNVGDLQNYPQESLKDLILTDNYIVTAGFVDSISRYICLRRYEKDNVINGSIQDITNVYDGSNCFYSVFPNDTILLSHFNEDTVAAATTSNINHPQNPYETLELFLFDLNNINFITMTDNKIRFYLNQSVNPELIGIVSSPLKHQVFVLQNKYCTSTSYRTTITSFICHNVSLYNLNWFYDSVSFMSFDAYNNNTQLFITGKYNYLFNNKIFYGIGDQFYNFSCINRNIITVLELPTYGVNTYNRPFIKARYTIDFDKEEPIVIYENPLQIDCEDFLKQQQNN